MAKDKGKVNEFSGQASQDLKELSTPPVVVSRKVDYETVDLQRYQRFITLESRRRFWTLAPDAVKQRVTDELLQLSPSHSTVKQARIQGWLPKVDGEERA